MNILFANYGNYTTNSLNHIGGFANWLCGEGHACIVAVPDGPETLSVVPSPRFQPATFAEILSGSARFADGRPADVLHAWTPREGVRKFVLAHQRLQPGTRLVVHLEDNEECLAAAFSGRSFAELSELADDELEPVLYGALPHPRRYRSLLRAADGCTVIVDRLREFLPGGAPAHLLLPGVDFTLHRPQAPDEGLRRHYGLKPGERVIVFTGSTTFANESAIRELVRAVSLLNERGTPVRLIRTGFHPDDFSARYDFPWKPFTLDAGFLEKSRLPALLALADVLVQPGRPGEFDDYRLPSKLPEFLAMGRPVVLPATNVGLRLRDGEDALLLREGAAEEIAGRCAQVFTDPALAARLGKNAAAFARQHFDLARIGPALLRFHESVREAPSRAGWSTLAQPHLTESALLPSLLRAGIEPHLARSAPDRARLLAAFDDLTRLLAQADTLAARGLARRMQTRLEQEIARLQERVRLADSHANNLEVALLETRRGVTLLEESVATFRRLYQNYQNELARTGDELARTGDELATRNRKIRRMQESFSWRVTAPLRALRRKFLDPRGQSGPLPVADKPAATSALKFRIDEPCFRQAPAGPLTIRGWCLLSGGQPATRVRALIDGRFIEGIAGEERLDVAAVHGDAAARSGFEVDVVLESGRHEVTLEVAGDSGNWLRLWETSLRTFTPVLAPAVESYEQWIHLYEDTSPRAMQALAKRVTQLPSRPLISVLLPVYNTPEKWLRRAIASVQSQAYDRWELCIADDASSAPHVRPLLAAAAREDARIKVAFREQNGHISHASNSALQLASGGFIALLDHDDELAPHALAEVALALAASPAADLLYSDEDKIDGHGRRSAPYFKPDFLPDLFLAQNYLTHLAVHRTALVREAGGFRPGFEGAQDWDLALRVFERTSAERIVHVPKVLYHWRAIPGSTALSLDQKNYHLAAARRALEEHLDRTGQKTSLAPVEGGHWRVIHALPAEPPLVSIIIPTRNGLHHLRRCIESLRGRTTYPRYEILVVDNGSDEPAALAYLSELAKDGVRVLPWPQPFNYSALNNPAARHARGELLALLNNDLEVITPGWLEEMAAQALRPGLGCVGAMLYYPDNLMQHAGVVLGVGGVAGHAFKKFPRGHEGSFNRARLAQNWSAVTAACLVIRKSTYEQVGGLDETDLAVAFNDVDFCLKVRAAGHRNLWTPFAEFYHHESATRGVEDTPAKQVRFSAEVATMLARWGDTLRADPAYNPNLSLESEDFALAFPPRLTSQDASTIGPSRIDPMIPPTPLTKP